MGQLPLIVSYVLIQLKAHSTLHLKHTHTHTHTHTSKHTTWHLILNLRYICGHHTPHNSSERCPSQHETAAPKPQLAHASQSEAEY